MRIYNFAAGPACLPLPVLEKVRDELVEHQDHGMSVMEMSHRSKMFEEILAGAESALAKLMGIPENYKILFLQGGASTQFGMVPLNLMTKNGKADYVKTGVFASKAIAQAKVYGQVNVVASSEDESFTYIPELDPSKFDPEADYFHITTNNTIYGTRYRKIPQVGNVPLVADMSSNILSEKSEVMDVSKYGLIFAGAQKNIGPSGVTLVIIREDLMGKTQDKTPVMMDYKLMADNDSMYNTPPTFGIYVAKLVFEWLLSIGGVEAIQKQNEYEAGLLYNFLDDSSLFKPTIAKHKEDRSIMNVTFVLPTDELNAKFVKEAAEAGFVNLKGHRKVGGMRASIYNAMPVEGVEKLVEFMKKFELNNK